MMKKCFLTGEFVFYATDRAKRPHSFKRQSVSETPREYCPFCPENEAHVPAVLYRSENNRIRIIKNKYPFIAENDRCFGVHDVLIDTPKHDERLSQFSDDAVNELMQAIKLRFNQLFSDDRSAYVQVFKNQGIDAGASQSHSHWQITSLCVIPVKMEHILGVLKNYYYERGACYFCNMDFGDRIVEENDDFITYIPSDCKFAYGMDILPKKHISSVGQMTDEELKNLGIILRNAVKRLVTVSPGVSYNICFYSAPKGYEYDKYFHFYATIIPRIGHMAGFEFSTGCYINSVLPEDAARTLRDVSI